MKYGDLLALVLFVSASCSGNLGLFGLIYHYLFIDLAHKIFVVSMMLRKHLFNF